MATDPAPKIAEVASLFDAVLFFTWSDWESEPRSNRFHYATRFARNVPVYFFQHAAHTSEPPVVARSSGVPNLTICDISLSALVDNPASVFEFLAKSTPSRYLIWVYDHKHYRTAYALFPSSLIIYHATENYLIDSDGWLCSIDEIANLLLESLAAKDFDFIVACAPSIKASILKHSFYTSAEIHVAPNGCDVKHIESIVSSTLKETPSVRHNSRRVVFQGSINTRIDFALLSQVCEALPQYTFDFYGHVGETNRQWDDLLAHKNVNHHGVLSIDTLYRELVCADVAIIPYISDEWIRCSLPLKSFEYLACGLPVVSVPIDYLSGYPDVFTIASTPSDYVRAIVSQAARRSNQKFLEAARLAVKQHDYDVLFDKAIDAIQTFTASSSEQYSHSPRTSALILYCPASTRIACVKEHLSSFSEFSTFNCDYLPATPDYWNTFESELSNYLPLEFHYDVLVIHYSIRISIQGHHIYPPLLSKLYSATCRKIVFIQDEYDTTETSRRFLDFFEPDLVFTNISLSDIHKVYPQHRFPKTRFIPTLTGYVGDTNQYAPYVRPHSDRRIFFAYRGRKLPPYYGRLGLDKYNIGNDVAAYCHLHQVACNISNSPSDRINGYEWYHFLGSARATLGTESGSNLFDMTGSFKRLFESALASNINISYEDFYDKYLSEYDDYVSMGQISPKFFEAISLRTALVLYEGSYSGVLQPNIHYLPLQRDLSNIDSIISFLSDDHLVKELTDRAYSDIVESGRYSYRSFILEFDKHVANLLLKSCSSKLRLPSSRDFLLAPLPKMPHLLFREYQLTSAIPSSTSSAIPSSTSSASHSQDSDFLFQQSHTYLIAKRAHHVFSGVPSRSKKLFLRALKLCILRYKAVFGLNK